MMMRVRPEAAVPFGEVVFGRGAAPDLTWCEESSQRWARGGVTDLSVHPARSTGPALFEGGWAVRQLGLSSVAPVLGAAIAGVVYPAMAGKPSKAGRKQFVRVDICLQPAADMTSTGPEGHSHGVPISFAPRLDADGCAPQTQTA